MQALSPPPSLPGSATQRLRTPWVVRLRACTNLSEGPLHFGKRKAEWGSPLCWRVSDPRSSERVVTHVGQVEPHTMSVKWHARSVLPESLSSATLRMRIRKTWALACPYKKRTWIQEAHRVAARRATCMPCSAHCRFCPRPSVVSLRISRTP
jgi:hypothetical protein